MSTFLLFAGCGGSGHSSSTTSRPPGGVATGTSSTSSTATTPPPASTRGGGSQPGSGGASNARVPATFVIHAGDRLVPPVISIPAFLAIQLTAVSADGHAHTLVFNGRSSVRLNVPAGGRGSVLIPGLRNGQYPVLVDGARRGSLMIGGEPGP